MNKKIKELEATLKRERYDSLLADKAWQAKVSDLMARIRSLEFKIQILEEENDD